MMNQQIQKAEALREMHKAPPILVLPNAWDAISARLFEHLGARTIATTSSGVANSLGYPDGEKVPSDLMLQAVARMVRVVNVPVTADVEAGYGASPEAAAKTAREVLATGAVGLNLEDATGDASKKLFDLNLQVERVRAVREAANHTKIPLVLNARTDVYLAQVGAPESRFTETVRRLNAFREAGADCLFAPGLTDAATIAQLIREISGPLNILATAGAPSVPELEKLGVARVSVGSGLMRSSIAHASDAARELLESGTYSGFLNRSIAYADLNELLRSRLRSDVSSAP